MTEPWHFHVQWRWRVWEKPTDTRRHWRVNRVRERVEPTRRRRFDLAIVDEHEAWMRAEAVVGHAVLDLKVITNGARSSDLQQGRTIVLAERQWMGALSIPEYGPVASETEVRVRRCRSECETDPLGQHGRDVPFDDPW